MQSVQNVSVAENVLKQLIIRDALAVEWQAQLVPTDTPSFDATPVNLTDALTEARANRPELKRLTLERDINEIDQKYFRNQTKPQVDLVGTVATTGLSGTPTSENFERSLFDVGAVNTTAEAFLLQQINEARVRVGLPAAVPPSVVVENGVPERLIGGYGRTLRNLLEFRDEERALWSEHPDSVEEQDGGG